MRPPSVGGMTPMTSTGYPSRCTIPRLGGRSGIVPERSVHSLDGTFVRGRKEFETLLTSQLTIELIFEDSLEFGFGGRFVEGLKTGCL